MDHRKEHSDLEHSHECFVKLLTEHYFQLNRYILMMVPNKVDAEDILQNTLVYLWQNFESFELETNFYAWAGTVARYQVMTHRKKVKRSRLHFDESTILLIEDETKSRADKETARSHALNQCLLKLPAKDYDTMIARYTQSKSVKELAKGMGITESGMYKYCGRIRDMLLDCVRNTLARGEAK